MKIRWLGVLLLVAVASCSTDSSHSGTPGEGTLPSAEASNSTGPTLPRLDCSPPAGRSVIGAPVVPDGAVAARMCGGLVDNAGFNSVWPADTLTGSRVVALVARLNKLKPYTAPSGCTLPLSTPFDLILEYPTGRRVLIHGDTSGNCAHLTVQGAGEWSGSGAIRDRTLALIKDQRAANTSLTQSAQPNCPEEWQDVSQTIDSGAVVPGVPVKMTACEYRLRLDPRFITQSARGSLVKKIEVVDPAPILRAALAGLKPDPCNGDDALTPTQQVVLISDRFGDVHVVPTDPCSPYSLAGTPPQMQAAQNRQFPTKALADLVAALF